MQKYKIVSCKKSLTTYSRIDIKIDLMQVLGWRECCVNFVYLQLIVAKLHTKKPSGNCDATLASNVQNGPAFPHLIFYLLISPWNVAAFLWKNRFYCVPRNCLSAERILGFTNYSMFSEHKMLNFIELIILLNTKPGKKQWYSLKAH